MPLEWEKRDVLLDGFPEDWTEIAQSLGTPIDKSQPLRSSLGPRADCLAHFAAIGTGVGLSATSAIQLNVVKK